MALRIIKSCDPIKVEQVNLCIYAQPGLGKTSLGYTAEDPIALDFDRGSHRAKNRKDVVRVSSWADVTAITAQDLAPYKTVITDTAGRALDFLTADIIAENPKMGRGGALTLQGYGALKSRFTSWLKMLNTFGKDVVLIAHMDEQRNGDDVIERLDVQGGSKGEIYKSADAMGRIIIRNNQRMLDFSPRENSFGKNPCGFELTAFPDPLEVPDTLAKLIATMKERLNQMSAEQKDAQAVIEEWSEALNDFSTAEDFNRCLSDFKKVPQAVKSMVAKRATSLGLGFNKSNGVFEELAHANG